MIGVCRRVGNRPRILAWLGVLALGAVMAATAAIGAAPATAPERIAVVLTLDGAIGPASSDYVARSLAKASARNAAIVVLRMDTPGGLDTSMREIIRSILTAPMPVLTYVSPSGARAASAGTYILYASHVAAMAPGTNLGAATPVAIGGGFPGRDDDRRDPFRRDEGKRDEGKRDDAKPAEQRRGEESGTARDADKPAAARDGEARRDDRTRTPDRSPTAMERKVVNDAVAYIRSLAEMRGRNADWAEAAVREGVSLAANDALKQNVIDIVAPTLEDALAQAHGREVVVGQGRVVLDTKGLIQQPIDPDWRTRLLGTLTNPNLALILMMIGIYGLLFEFMNPGALYPGTIGAICLLLGLYALTALPLNYAGLALMALGVALMVAEAFSPSLGILGIGGAIAFVLGGMILIDTEAPGFDVSVGVLAGVAVAGLAFTLLVARAALRSRRRPIVSGTEGMVGGTAKVIDWSGDTGFVWFQGERWSAVSSRPLSPGEQVRVLGRDGLSLRVEPAESRTS